MASERAFALPPPTRQPQPPVFEGAGVLVPGGDVVAPAAPPAPPLALAPAEATLPPLAV